MAEFHCVLVVVFGIVDSAHHSLVIAKEEDGQASDAVDGNQQAPLFQLMDHVAPRNKIHDDLCFPSLWTSVSRVDVLDPASASRTQRNAGEA